jgi:hypothetical protein
MRIRLHPLFNADPGAGGGAPPAPAPAPAPAPSGSDPLAAFQNLMARAGSDAAALARQLFDENYRYRDRIRELEKTAPAQGAVVLSADDAAKWQAYQTLGAPADVQKTIEAGKTLQRDLELRDVAAAAGYSTDVLRTLAGDLAFEVRDEQKDNKPVKAVYVKVDGKDIPIETHATAQWAAFLPALKPVQAGQAGAPAIGASNPVGSHGQTPPTPFDPKNPPSLHAIQWKT